MLRVVILMHRRDRVVLEGQYPEILIIVERAIGPIDLGLPLFDHGVSLGQHRTIGNKRGAQRLRSEPALDKLAFLGRCGGRNGRVIRSEEHTSELQSLMRSSYAVFCLKKKHIYCTYVIIS